MKRIKAIVLLQIILILTFTGCFNDKEENKNKNATVKNIEPEIKIPEIKIEDNKFRVHYRRTDGEYKNWGLHLWGNAIEKSGYGTFTVSGKNYTWESPLLFDNKDEFGVYADIALVNNSSILNYMIHNQEIKDVTKHRIFPDFNKYTECWIIEGNENNYTKKPDVNNLLYGIKLLNNNSDVTVGEKIRLNIESNPLSFNLTASYENLSAEIIHIENGEVTGLKEGTGEFIIRTEGLEYRARIFVIKKRETGKLRVHFKRFDNNYANYSILYSESDNYIFEHTDSFGRYADIDTKITNTSVRVRLKNSSNTFVVDKYVALSDKEIWLVQGSENVYTEKPEINKGAFKLANSMGTGDSWERVEDGYLNISYDAMKKFSINCFLFKPIENYSPKAVAVINIEHKRRDELELRVGKVNQPDKYKILRCNISQFTSGNFPSPEYPFPQDDIIIDITELLPFDKEEIYLSVTDSGNTRAEGLIKKFDLEVYDDYNRPYTKLFSSDEVPKKTVNNSEVKVVLKNAEYQLSSKQIDDNYIVGSGKITAEEKNSLFRESLLGENSEAIEKLLENGELKVIREIKSASKRAPASKIDHSRSKYFPPIGAQGDKNSCVSWSIGYYITTFYEARKNNWDLSKAKWINGKVQDIYADKIMSPDFIYSMLNGGRNIGTRFPDNMRMVSEIGICTLKEMNVNESDIVSWGNGKAWREAPKHRQVFDSSIYFIAVSTDKEISLVKELLQQGYILSTGIDATSYGDLSKNDTWTTENFNFTSPGHANTIVGYDDDFVSEN